MQLRTNFQNACRMVFRRPVSYSEKVPSEKPPKTFFDLTVCVYLKQRNDVLVGHYKFTIAIGQSR